MAIGVISDDAFVRESNRFKANAREVQILGSAIPEIKEIERGRGNTSEIPQEIRRLAAQESIAGARASDVAVALGISKSSVSAYKNSATSTASYNNPNEDLQESNNKFKDKIKTLASERLEAAILSITSEKLEKSRLNVIAGVARDMSTIVKNMEPEGPKVQQNQVIIYKPRSRDEDEYEIIDVQKSE